MTEMGQNGEVHLRKQSKQRKIKSEINFFLLSNGLFVKIKKHEYTCPRILYLCRSVAIKEEADRGY